ncbi:hypothetical protein FQN55_006373 [Onygenales sp. PD_40]|nr:hypothetical protein FQN55_006373 [Onygenales sp. PD_40]
MQPGAENAKSVGSSVTRRIQHEENQVIVHGPAAIKSGENVNAGQLTCQSAAISDNTQESRPLQLSTTTYPNHQYQTESKASLYYSKIANVVPVPVLPSPTAFPSLANNKQLAILWHYFRSVCVVNSCYDSFINPFRTGVQSLMYSSRLIYSCIMSMSAAHLSHTDPKWVLESLEYHAKAISTLRTELAKLLSGTSTSASTDESRDHVLLGVILLGTSSSWHPSSGLGLEHITGSRALFKRWIYQKLDKGVSAPDWPRFSFYLGLQAYWETVASFLVDQDLDQLEYLNDACMKLPTNTVYVHPWTGISSTLWMLLAKAGCLTRRKRICTLLGSPLDRTLALDRLEEQARRLEGELLAYAIPDASGAESTYDEQTPISHLEDIARCCKFAALLELYRAFATICHGRRVVDAIIATDGKATSGRFNPDEPHHPTVADVLAELSLGIIKTLQSIPENSNTRCLHPLLLLISGSALSTRLLGERVLYMGPPSAPSPILPSSPETPTTGGPGDDKDPDPITIIKSWRQFVHDRITHVEQVINLDSMRNMRRVLQEVWAQDDELRDLTSLFPDDDVIAAEPCHWIDIMEKNKLEFLF